MLHPSSAPRSRTLAAALALSLVFHLALLLLDLELLETVERDTFEAVHRWMRANRSRLTAAIARTAWAASPSARALMSSE